MLATIGTFLLSPFGRYLLIGLLVLGAILALYLYVYHSGEAAAIAAATTAALERATAAAKAKAQVDHSKKAVDDDPYNLDRRG